MGVVEEVIIEYLRSNRRLVVPTFGAFMVKESGEKVFSELLRTDDGVLSSLLRDRGLNELESAVVTDRFIFNVRHELEQYGYCRLEEIGILRIEPTTKTVRLYPLVQGELPKQTPYIPNTRVEERAARDERQEARDERVADVQVVEEKQPHTPNISNTSNTPIPAKPSRKKFDFVMIAAVVILVVALVAIGYGWYVSNLAEFDDVEIEKLRVVPELKNE